jgi:hypothetical protein
MARKTLGKMEFASLIDTLQQQNAAQLEAQQETTKMVANVYAFFLKQDRVEARKALEKQMEAKEKEGGDGSGKKTKENYEGKTAKGIFRRFIDFFLTGALGSAGKGIFRTLWQGVTFGGAFFKGLAGFMGGLILAPQLWDSIKQGLDEGDGILGVVDKAVSHFLNNVSWIEGMSAAALVGLGVAGPSGAIAAAITFGALKGISSIIGKDATIGDFFAGNVGTFETALAGTALGATAGFTIGAKFGLPGAVGGLLLGAGFGALAGVLISKETKLNPVSIMTAVLGGFAGGLLGLKVGAMLGAVGGPVGMIAGALLGAAIGLALGSLATSESDAEKSVKGIATRAAEIKILNRKAQKGTITQPEEAKLQSMSKAQQSAVTKLSSQTTSGSLGQLALAYGGTEKDMKHFIDAMSGQKIKEWRVDFNKRFNTNITAIGEYVDYSVKEGIFKWKKDLIVTKPDTIDNQKHTIKAGTEFDAGIQQTGESFMPWRLNDMILQAYSTSSYKKEHRAVEAELNKGKSFFAWNKEADEQPYFDKFLEAAKYARGFGAFNAPRMIQVGDQPKAQGQELVFTEKKFNQIIGDILENYKLKEQKNMAMAMLPAMSQGSGGASMPVVNNSYSYQNVDNIVAELPATSTLNMTNALA